MLKLFSVFHCNLASSLIPSHHYRTVIERCYKPLLDICEAGTPLGIEMPAWTLREIAKLDMDFVERLARLWEKGGCEFIGSGFAKAVFPLIPAEVNRWNLESGNLYYEHLLGRTPRTALVNEQVWSSGLAPLYKDAGYEAVIMGWSGPFRANKYPKDYLYSPQRTAYGEVGVLWSHALASEKLKMCVHGEIAENEYLEWLKSHESGASERGLALYVGEAEAFDYRPGAETHPEGEYVCVRRLCALLEKDGSAGFLTPGAFLDLMSGAPGAMNPISLESPTAPIVCGAEDGGNPVRFAVGGRDSAHINTECHKAYNHLKTLINGGLLPEITAECFKEALCELWSSDFRTNAMDDKFRYFQDRLGWLKLETERMVEKELRRKTAPALAFSASCAPQGLEYEPVSNKVADLRKLSRVSVKSSESTVKVSTDDIEIEFLKNKGCAIKSLSFPGISEKPLIGTLKHGYYEDIHMGADFYSGHLIHVTRDGRKTTDLKPSEPELAEDSERVILTIDTTLEIGHLRKVYAISKQEPEVSVTYRLKVNGLVSSSLRAGILTLIPDAFDRESLWFETLNGGPKPERFPLRGRVAHDEPQGTSVTASGCLGATGGWVSIGDKDKSISVYTDKSSLYSAPMLRFTCEPQDSFFLRLYHSLGEVDDAAWWVWRGYNEITFTIKGHAGEA